MYIYSSRFVVPFLICIFSTSVFSESPKDQGTVVVSKILFGSCIKQTDPMPIFKTINKEHPDMFIFLGDNIYGDTEDMSVLQNKYNLLNANPGFAKLRNSTNILATWDDHDYGVNDGGASYPKRVESEKIFLDFWKVAKDSPRRSRPGIYGVHTFGPAGKRIQVILLDTRYFRGSLKRGEKRTGGPYYPSNNPEITMLGPSQWNWLEKQLKQPADLRIIATSIQCVATDAGQETWSNLPHERKRLFKLIKETQANGVLMISGDRHWSELSIANDATTYPLYDLTSSSLNRPHPRGTPTENRNRDLDTTYHKVNFGSININWEENDPTLTLAIQDIAGEVQFSKTLHLSQLK